MGWCVVRLDGGKTLSLRRDVLEEVDAADEAELAASSKDPKEGHLRRLAGYAGHAMGSLLGMGTDTPEIEALDAAPLDALPSTLHLLATRGDAKALQDCLSRGASVDEVDCDGDSPLQLATMGGHLEA